MLYLKYFASLLHWLSVKHDISLPWVQPGSRLQLSALFKAQDISLQPFLPLLTCLLALLTFHLISSLNFLRFHISTLYLTPLSLCSSHHLFVLPVFLLPFHLFAPTPGLSHHLASFSDDCPGAFHLIWRQRAEYTCVFFCESLVIWNINAGIIWLPGCGMEVAGAL